MPKNEPIAGMAGEGGTFTRHSDLGVVVGSDWNLLDGRMEPTRVWVRSIGDSRPIGAELIKRLPLGSILKTHRARMVTHTERGPDPKRSALYGARRGIAMTPEALGDVAAVYRRAYARGEPVQRAVADAFGIATSTAANRIMLARRAGHDMPNPKETGR